jgi:hypothetical protein
MGDNRPLRCKSGRYLFEPPGNVFVGETMKSVAADSLLIVSARQREAAHDRIDRLMEGCVEASDLRQIRPQRCERADRRETARLVQRSKRRQPVQGFDHVRCQTDGFDELAPAMHDTVAGGDQFPAAKFALDPVEQIADARIACVSGKRPFTLY